MHRNTSDDSVLVRAKDSNVFSCINVDTAPRSGGKTLETQPGSRSYNIVASSERHRDTSKRDTCNLIRGPNSSAGDSHGQTSQNDLESVCRDNETSPCRLSDSNFQNRIPVHIQGSAIDKKLKCSLKVCQSRKLRITFCQTISTLQPLFVSGLGDTILEGLNPPLREKNLFPM